jgi:hypothetical protein
LQIKIDEAKKQLPEETLRAIDAVPWQAEILKMRETKGFSFEQLGDLELETELLLCGLVPPADYPKEIEKRMGISKAAANELVEEMNQLVFAKIKEEMIRSTEVEMPPPRPDVHRDTPQEGNHTQIFKDHGIEILPVPEKLELTTPVPPSPSQGEGPGVRSVPPILAQKLSAPTQIGIVKTEHTLENITKTVPIVPADVKPKIPKPDPYREIPE